MGTKKEQGMSEQVQAEAALLGSILLDAHAMVPARGLKPEHFIRDAHMMIFLTLRLMEEDGLSLNLETLQTRLERTGQLKRVGGREALEDLENRAIVAARPGQYSELVRQIVEGGAASEAPSQKGGKDALASLSLEELRVTLLEQAPGIERADVLLGQEFAPILWVVPDLLAEGLTLLAAKPKLGKSWMALGLGLAVAHGGIALGKLRVERGQVSLSGAGRQPQAAARAHAAAFARRGGPSGPGTGDALAQAG